MECTNKILLIDDLSIKQAIRFSGNATDRMASMARLIFLRRTAPPYPDVHSILGYIGKITISSRNDNISLTAFEGASGGMGASIMDIHE